MRLYRLISKANGLARLALDLGELRLLHNLEGSDLGSYLNQLPPDLPVAEIWSHLRDKAHCRSCETVRPSALPNVFVSHQGEEWAVALFSPRPAKVSAVGLNYRSHASEQGKEAPSSPMFFSKARTCLIGSHEPIELPAGQPEIDVEVELVVVIGRDCYQISPEQADDHILGYTIGNDVSDREAQRNDKQFYRAKSFRTFGPVGPCVVLGDSFRPGTQKIQLWLNDNLQQDSTLDNMMFSVPQLVSRLSQVFPLERGELLFTGTPEGVGAHRKPPIFLKNQDQVRCHIDGIGILENPVTTG